MLNGTTAHPTAAWSIQMARNAAMDLEDHVDQFTYLIRDRGPQFSASFDAVVAATGIGIITTAVRAPAMNASQERWRRSVRTELLDRTLVWDLAHLHRFPAEYESYYNDQRPHCALGQAAPLKPPPDNVVDLDHFEVTRHDRIGGILHEYHLAS